MSLKRNRSGSTQLYSKLPLGDLIQDPKRGSRPDSPSSKRFTNKHFVSSKSGWAGGKKPQQDEEASQDSGRQTIKNSYVLNRRKNTLTEAEGFPPTVESQLPESNRFIAKIDEYLLQLSSGNAMKTIQPSRKSTPSKTKQVRRKSSAASCASDRRGKDLHKVIEYQTHQIDLLKDTMAELMQKYKKLKKRVGELEHKDERAESYHLPINHKPEGCNFANSQIFGRSHRSMHHPVCSTCSACRDGSVILPHRNSIQDKSLSLHYKTSLGESLKNSVCDYSKEPRLEMKKPPLILKPELFSKTFFKTQITDQSKTALLKDNYGGRPGLHPFGNSLKPNKSQIFQRDTRSSFAAKLDQICINNNFLKNQKLEARSKKY